ncbi:MAG: glucosaminidase domain-containing protein [Steroidobacterales bacterium]
MTSPTHIAAQIPLTTASANTYTDTNGLAALKANPGSPQALHVVAQQVDALFLQMMLKSMRDASADVGEPESNELGMYQDMFDKQIALTMSQHQGLGLGAAMTARLPGASAASTAPPATHATGAAPASAPAAPSAPAGIAQSAEDFVSQVLPTIQQAAQALGVSPLGMLAQAALETAWGQRMARTADGAPSLNLFGIKAGDGWAGPRATAATLEFKSGVATPLRTAFRAYESIQASVQDFANLLQSSPRYARAVAAGANAQAYVAAIGQAGYATDPEYGNKLSEILNSGTLRTALRNAAAVL